MVSPKMLKCPWCGQLCKGLIGLETHQRSCKKKLEKDYSYFKKSGSDAILSFDPNDEKAVEVVELFHKFEEQEKGRRAFEEQLKLSIGIASFYKEGVINPMKKMLKGVDRENVEKLIEVNKELLNRHSEMYDNIKRAVEKRAFMGYDSNKDDERILSLAEELKTIESENIRELKKMLEEKEALKICSYCGHKHEILVDICEKYGTKLRGNTNKKVKENDC